jgi:hypothetical protein
MGKPPRARHRRPAASHGAARAGPDRRGRERRFRVGRGFLRHANFNRQAVMITKPQAVAFEAGGRRQPFDVQAFEVFAKSRQIIFERPERQIVQLLARSFGEQSPPVAVAVGVEREPAALPVHVETERLVEGLRLLQIGHRHAEMVKRMHAQHPGAARRLDKSPNLRHRSAFLAIDLWPCPSPRPGSRKDVKIIRMIPI